MGEKMGAILNGRELSDKILAQVAVEVESLKQSGITPKLCVILVGDNPASLSYVNMKHRACEKTGIESQVLKFDENMSQNALLSEIERLNNDESVSGILVQLPLPKHISTEAVLEAICPKKDVDGFHPYNVGRLVAQSLGNSSLTQSSRELEKSSIDRPSVLSHSDFSAQPTNLAQDTRIAESKNATESSLRGNAEASVRSTDPHLQIQENIDCHDSANAESRNDESSKNNTPRGSIFRRFCGFSSARRGNRTDLSIDEAEREESRKSVKKTNAHYILAPATPLGIMALLHAYSIEVSGKNVAIIGASNIVGKPLSALMLNAGATISVCHILTKDISVFTKSADIVCVGVGKVNLITENMIKDGAIVVDIGINKVNGKIVGDVDFENVAKKASFITPVPGGVGPMTIAMLLKNTLLCARILSEANK